MNYTSLLNWLIMRCKLRPQLAAEAQQTAWSKCRLKSSQINIFNHLSQGNSTNYYIMLLGPRNKAASPTSQQVGHFGPKRVKYRHRHHFYFYFFLIYRRALFALSQSEARFAELCKYSENMLSEVFWTPNIASAQFDEYPELGSRSKC